jgi:hypothetical protein
MTIEKVLHELEEVIEESVRQKSHHAIFAYVYLRTTAQIKAEVEAGSFENDERLQNFDVIFANLYLQAYKNYIKNEDVSESWKIAFDSGSERLTIIQHLLMGMNAHINLDLAVAASEIMQGKPISDLKNDFNKINDILAGLLNEMQVRIGKASKMMFLLDWLGGRKDEKIINFSMKRARNHSWAIANELWLLNSENRKLRAKEVDQDVRKISEFLKSPPSIVLRLLLKLIGFFEDREVGNIIQKLKQ